MQLIADGRSRDHSAGWLKKKNGLMTDQIIIWIEEYKWQILVWELSGTT